MYNPIEVMHMTIEQAQIKYLRKGGFDAVSNEGLRHVKVLPYLSVVQSVHGSYDISLGSSEPEQTGDGGFFVAPSEVQQTIVHHVNPTSRHMSARWLFLDVQVNGVYRLDSLYRFPLVLPKEAKDECDRLFDRIFSTDDIWENYSDCYRLLGLLVRHSTPMQTDPQSDVQAAIGYLTSHYREPITVRDLATVCKMSESNFYAVFKKQLGNSPISYLNHYRLSLAAEQLMETDRSVGEISDSVGIPDALYFSRLFKKVYGLPPREYRLTYRRRG